MTKEANGRPISEYFGENQFDIEKMKRALPASAFQKLMNVIQRGEKLDLETANLAAIAMKDWAVGKGCTHYTHWFQPMTGFTAEKHDAFIVHGDNGRVIESFTGRQLIQGEPDASSFPSGGLRATFEARGYSIWDPTSPAFVLEYPHGNTLCIPSVFISYHGETLDKKAPLLRSIEALNQAALAVLALFDNPATRVFSTLGVEQEYFLIDRAHYRERLDLMQTGRTLFGKAPAKHQQLEDQYFGNIPERAFAFMTGFEEEAYRLGIPLKTRHNEVAPNQFEVAPIFEDVNVAVDHNQILMDLMDRVARRHSLAVLFHEKPFAYVNGSGKHCNWAIGTDTGENLLNPGKTPQSNLQFLVFFVCTLKAVHDHSLALRAAIASAANDHRLGANEAPPAIISAFVGSLLTKVLDDLAAGRVTEQTDQAWLNVGIDKIPDIPKDNTDRNRTSPFAFTGNKFEFRAVGSSDTPSTAVTVLNCAVAEKLDEFTAELAKERKKSKDFNGAVVAVLRRFITAARAVFFEGDNYSEEWVKEAERRGLPNLKTTPEAAAGILAEASKKMFTRFRVYNERELEAWYHIDMENYIKTVDIECRVSLNMVRTMYIPAAVNYINDLTAAAAGLREILGEKDPRDAPILRTIREVADKLALLSDATDALYARVTEAEKIDDIREKGMAFVRVKSQREEVRRIVDAMEGFVSDEHWPVPKYREILLGL